MCCSCLRFANLAGVAALIGKSATYAIAVQICKVLASKSKHAHAQAKFAIA
jgi:hypothetical protein